MKIINYNYGYRTIFNCSIHGRIIATKEEWNKALNYISRVKADTSYPFYKTMAREDIKNSIHTKKGDLFNIRVWATSKIASKFKLKKYKTGNYEFLVLK